MTKVFHKLPDPNFVPFDKRDHPIRVDYALAIPLLVQAGLYDVVTHKFPTTRSMWAAPDGTVAHYPALGKVVMHPLLIEVDKKTTETVEQVQAKLAELRLRPANLHELLCFGLVHKELQIKYHIVAAGSVTPDRSGYPRYASLTGVPATLLSAGVKGFGGATRHLFLDRFGRWIGGDLRFLAVPLPDPWSDDPAGGAPVLVVAPAASPPDQPSAPELAQMLKATPRAPASRDPREPPPAASAPSSCPWPSAPLPVLKPPLGGRPSCCAAKCPGPLPPQTGQIPGEPSVVEACAQAESLALAGAAVPGSILSLPSGSRVTMMTRSGWVAGPFNKRP
jgi:hypothetical protein